MKTKPGERALLEAGKVFCHRCNGFGRSVTDADRGGCVVCDGTGLLRRERFGVRNPTRQDLSANESLAFVNGMPVEWEEKKIVRLNQRHELEGGEIPSVFVGNAMPAHAASVPICASEGLTRRREGAKEEAIECRMPVALPDSSPEGPPSEVMVMPGGLHTITPSQGGKPVTVTVKVGPDAAAALQQALRAHLAAGPQKPWFDFDHAGGPASAWPLEFFWKDSPAPGVYARVEWSKAGAEAISGKMYRAFSPMFFVDSTKANPARVTGAPLNMGSLVNQPAFKQISPLWCADGQQARGNEGKVDMTEQELANLRARLVQLEKENSELRAAQASSANEAAIAAKDEEIAQLKQALKKVEGELAAHNKARAKAAVMAAVARGALPAKDEALQAKWAGLIEADPSNEVMLANLPGNPALKPITAAEGHGTGDELRGSVMISRESSYDCIRAYATERDARKRGAIYASELSPRIRKHEEIPLVLKPEHVQQLGLSPIQAANSLGTLATDVVTQRVLEYLMTSFPILSRISTDMSAETVRYNNYVDVNLVTPPTATDYDTTNGYSDSDATVTQKQVKLDAHKAIQIKFNEEELASTSRNLFEEQAPLMAYVLGKALVTKLYSIISVANFPKATNETVVTLANFSRKGVMSLGRKLTDREVPDVLRTLLLNGAYYDKLGEDTVVVSAFNNPNAGDIIQSGVLPEVHGFSVADAKILQATENLTGFACFPSALLMATRLPDDYTKILPGVTGGAVTRVITEPKTGVSLLIVEFVDHIKARAYRRAAFMYGAGLGDPSAGERLVSAATP